MIDHVSIGVREIAEAKAFYDAALKPIGYSCLSSSDGSLGYGNEQVAFWISASPSPVPSDPQSGLHFCFTTPTRKSVDAFHQAAIRHGGRDNGKPGLRADFKGRGRASASTSAPQVRMIAPSRNAARSSRSPP